MVGMGVSSTSMSAHSYSKQALEKASSQSRAGQEDVGVSDIMGKHEVVVVRTQGAMPVEPIATIDDIVSYRAP
jgi:hypothetical protein